MLLSDGHMVAHGIVIHAEKLPKEATLPSWNGLCDNGCPWDKDTCYYAAQGGHFEKLQWAHANGCPWDDSTWSITYSPNIRQWLRENGCPG